MYCIEILEIESSGRSHCTSLHQDGALDRSGVLLLCSYDARDLCFLTDSHGPELVNDLESELPIAVMIKEYE